MAGIEVSTADGQVRSATDAGGAFTLLLPDKHSGDSVTLKIHSEGHEVVNDLQLEQTLAQEAEGGPVVLLLCKAGNREEMVRRLVLLMAVKAIGETYQKRLKELEKEKEKGLEGLPDLRRRLYQAEAAFAATSMMLARQTVNRSSRLHRLAMGSFLQGQLDRAWRFSKTGKEGIVRKEQSRTPPQKRRALRESVL